MGHEIVTGTSARVQAITINPETRSVTGGADVFGAAAGLP